MIKNSQLKKKKRMKSKIKMPNWLKNILRFSNPGGKKVKRIWEPSKGGRGIKLNIAKRILI